jgi:hypothetical protein
MKTNLIKLFAQKEVIWFYRMKEMKTKMNWVAFIIALVLQFVAQHSFALMHFVFEVALFLFARPTFKRNMQVMQKKVNDQYQNYNIVKQELITLSQ